MNGGPKVLAVTGVSAGIGRALVLEGLGRGHSIAGCARRADRLEALGAEVEGAARGRLHLATADVNDPEAMAGWLGAAAGRFGRIDAVVANAGFGWGGPLESLEVGDYRQQFETNFFSVVSLAKQAIPWLRQAGGGDLILVSSVLGLMSLPGRSAYCASKWALEGFAEAIRCELKPQRIRVSVINPGFTETEFGTAMKVRGPEPRPSRRAGMPADEVAREILSGLGETRRNVILTALGRTALWLRDLAPGAFDWVREREFRRTWGGPPGAKP